jgi:hypothetical protein
MGIGQQAGDHSSVSVILPYGAGTEVTSLVVKASQGGGTSSGTAFIYHDQRNPFDEDGALLDATPCVLPATPDTSFCFIPIDTGTLLNLDSLSIFVTSTGGSFEGASACVTLVPVPGDPNDIPGPASASSARAKR